MLQLKPSIVLVGAGNLATHLVPALYSAGYPVIQVLSRTVASARALAERLNCSYSTDAASVNKEAGLYLLCVKDDAIEQAILASDLTGKFLIHTSGSTSIDLLKKYSTRCAVLYPLQTFSKKHPVDLINVPIFVEGSSNAEGNAVTEMASAISNHVGYADSSQRLVLHLAAVIASNFSNHMYVNARQLLEAKGLSFDSLKPLILETARKVMSLDPAQAQTGPAVRNDQAIIAKHTEMLEEFPEMQKLYTFVSNSIIHGQR